MRSLNDLYIRKNNTPKTNTPATEISVGSVVGTAKNYLSIGNDVKATLAPPPSIARMAREAIFKFPVAISRDVDPAAIGYIVEAYQNLFTSFAMIAISLNNSVDTKQFSSLSSFLKTLHNDNGFDFNLDSAYSKIGESVSPSIEFPNHLKGLGLVCCEDIPITEAMESINDIYKPYQRTKTELNRRLSVANEARDNNSRANRNTIDALKKKHQQNIELQKQIKDLEANNKQLVNELRPSGKPGDPGINELANLTRATNRNAYLKETLSDKSSASRVPSHGANVKTMNAIQSARKIEPNLFNATFFIHGDGGTYTQTVLLGVKAVPILVKEDAMRYNMISAVQDATEIFRYLKVKNKQISVMDFVLGIDKAKASYLAKGKDQRWFEALSRRKEDAQLSRLAGGSVHKVTTIVLSDNDVHHVKEATGIDIANDRVVLRLLKKYYFLSLMITGTGTSLNKPPVKYIVDGDRNYTTTTLDRFVSDSDRDREEKETKIEKYYSEKALQ